MKKFLLILPFISLVQLDYAQNLPDQWTLNEAEHRLIQGGKWDTDIYQTDVIHTMDIVFASNNFWTQLTTNYNSATDLSATVTIDGTMYEQVGVRFKGQTSYMMTNGEEKKSFKKELLLN